MADVNSIMNIGVNIGILLLLVLFFSGVAVAIVYLMSQYKKWSQFTCVIWGRDGFNQLTERVDKAGIFSDRKTKSKRFYIRKSKVGLDCNDIPYIQSGKRKVVYLLQTGSKNFRFIRPNIKDNVMKYDVGEEDVNWAIHEFDKSKKLFDNNILMQYMPFILLGFVSIVILVMFIYFFKQFGVLKQMAVHLENAATIMTQNQGGSVVLQ